MHLRLQWVYILIYVEVASGWYNHPRALTRDMLRPRRFWNQLEPFVLGTSFHWGISSLMLLEHAYDDHIFHEFTRIRIA
jgi:hypothetical protein